VEVMMRAAFVALVERLHAGTTSAEPAEKTFSPTPIAIDWRCWM
jgi:hypothetical protein